MPMPEGNSASVPAPAPATVPVPDARRQCKTLDNAWAQCLARRAKAAGLTPNLIAVLSVMFAVLGAVCLMTASEVASRPLQSLVWLGAAGCIQLRLLCNLLDGMVAIEGG